MEIGIRDYQDTNWWKFLDESLKELVAQSFDLLENEWKRLALPGQAQYHDYAYIVFPAAKAYEGFLKRVFLDMKLITAQQYYGDHFRIGRALSPTLPKRYRTGWVYGRLGEYCGGDMLPMQMWEVWKKARNRTFHFFPQHRECVTLEEAGMLVANIVGTMGNVLSGCRIA